jgi:hypothetical protein
LIAVPSVNPSDFEGSFFSPGVPACAERRWRRVAHRIRLRYRSRGWNLDLCLTFETERRLINLKAK